MIRQRYKCTLISDIVITASAATEGFNPTLDYIPGSKFLGIVAKEKYSMDANKKEDTLNLFHRSNIHFGDAHPIINQNRSHIVPFTWTHPKGAKLDQGVWLSYLLNEDNRKHESLKGNQLKQVKKGFFVEKGNAEGNLLDVNKGFSIKSSYDRENRRSKDAQMYGYHALKKGTEWEFHVEINDDENNKIAEALNTSLIGKKRIGRSRSAEYGLVEIEYISTEKITTKFIPTEKKVFIKNINETKQEVEKEIVCVYAASNLCFYDRFGRNTLQPNAKQLGIPEGEILWKKSQIRTRIYQTWNQKRFNRDADRFIICKGSVFVVEVPKETAQVKTHDKIGKHYSEGFGKVFFNPSFLVDEKDAQVKINLKKVEYKKDDNYANVGLVVNESDTDAKILNILKKRSKQIAQELDIDKAIHQFKVKNHDIFSNISNSQWGALKNYAKGCKSVERFNILLFDDTIGFLNSGRLEEKWRGKTKILEKFLEDYSDKGNRLELAQKLFTEMARQENISHEN